MNLGINVTASFSVNWPSILSIKNGDESSIQSIVKRGWTYHGHLTAIPLQALPVRRGDNGRDEKSCWWITMMMMKKME